MKFPVFSVRDVKTGFGSPFVEQNEPAAVRGFRYAIARPGDIMGANPEDFSLWHVGIFNTETGVIEPVEPPHLVVDAVSLKES